MAEKMVTMTKSRAGKTKTVTVPKSAFDKVWKERGWTLKKDDKQKAPSPAGGATSETTTGNK